MLAAVTVTNDTDVVNADTSSIINLGTGGVDGISLREAIEATNNTSGDDEITFNNSLLGGVITLTMGELAIADDLTVTGLGAVDLTIDGNQSSRIFRIDGPGSPGSIDVTLSDLTLTGASTAGAGGGILSVENLTLNRSVVTANTASFGGGGIYSRGTLTVTSSTLSGNSAEFGGGGIYNLSMLSVTSSTLSGNSANGPGGGILSLNATLSVTSSILSGNSANGLGGGIYYILGTATLNNTIVAGSPGGDIDGSAGCWTALII